ncbi:gliding motility-associated C-terminal domain-containing protein [Flagellimonas marinaquae]|uniref:gliding motility-associated C-terminal domain-containing protein n=1 Tax=Flagellimonas marinaquae TaxID=254955 RepID=UPI000F8DD1BF|nr:gliding motility-associated C-terminal domain-containing protein [Allomuricauda aquimarina]
MHQDIDGNGVGDVCDVTKVCGAEAITPNGDGINDRWVIQNLQNYPNHEVRVFNTWGQQVFVAKGYDNTLDGSLKTNRAALPRSSYYYQIDLDGNGKIDFDGWIYVVREN